MKFLVTGGCGFIGANFVRLLHAERPDWTVVNLDKLTYAGNLENLEGIPESDRYRFVRGDICDPDTAARCMEGADVVVNFAAETHVDRSIEDAAPFLRTNVVGTQTLLEAARRAGGVRYVQVSTDEVYGALGEEGVFTEETPLAPNSPYAASKAGADLLVRAYGRTHGLPAVITRCSNNYGPYQFPEKVIPLFLSNAMEDKPLPLYGDGLQVRDWIHVEDHCRAVLAAAEKGSPGEVYNIGASNEVTNVELAKLLLKTLGKSGLITFVKDRPGHDRRYAISSEKAKRELGWAPRWGFEEGIARTVDWYRENRGWLDRARSGEYQTYYERMYKGR
jgi:dTDP-glucose 4,6-dehydratase